MTTIYFPPNPRRQLFELLTGFVVSVIGFIVTVVGASRSNGVGFLLGFSMIMTGITLIDVSFARSYGRVPDRIASSLRSYPLLLLASAIRSLWQKLRSKVSHHGP